MLGDLQPLTGGWKPYLEKMAALAGRFVALYTTAVSLSLSPPLPRLSNLHELPNLELTTQPSKPRTKSSPYWSEPMTLATFGSLYLVFVRDPVVFLMEWVASALWM